jgi:hypothetical protein
MFALTPWKAQSCTQRQTLLLDSRLVIDPVVAPVALGVLIHAHLSSFQFSAYGLSNTNPRQYSVVQMGRGMHACTQRVTPNRNQGPGTSLAGLCLSLDFQLHVCLDQWVPKLNAIYSAILLNAGYSLVHP